MNTAIHHAPGPSLGLGVAANLVRDAERFGWHGPCSLSCGRARTAASHKIPPPTSSLGTQTIFAQVPRIILRRIWVYLPDKVFFNASIDGAKK